MKIVLNDVPWVPKPNTCEWIQAEPEKPELITSCFVFAFYKEKLLMVNHITRGIEIPGGHREEGETAEQAIIRETKEEAEVSLKNIQFLGYLKISLLGPAPDGYKYPYPENKQAFFLAEVDSMDEFKPKLDSVGRMFLSEDEYSKVDWIQRNIDIYRKAIESRKKLTG